MWHGNTIYFVGPRPAERQNIWALDRATGCPAGHCSATTTSFPAIGPSDIVFQAGRPPAGLKTGRRNAPIRPSPIPDLAEAEKVAALIHGRVSLTGKRAISGARRRVQRAGRARAGAQPHARRRANVAPLAPTARRSPTGRSLGRYELTLRAADADATESSRRSAGFRYAPSWSPDSKRLVFVDGRPACDC
jgi:hypothetical protein